MIYEWRGVPKTPPRPTGTSVPIAVKRGQRGASFAPGAGTRSGPCRCISRSRLPRPQLPLVKKKRKVEVLRVPCVEKVLVEVDFSVPDKRNVRIVQAYEC